MSGIGECVGKVRNLTSLAICFNYKDETYEAIMAQEPVNYDINAIELKFIEQEHRFFHTIANLIKFRKGPEANRRAAILSFGWALAARSTQTVAAGGVGVVALLGLIAAFRANELVVAQNRRMDQQTLMIDAQRRASLNVEMSSIWDQIRAEYDATSVKGQKLRQASPLLTARLVYISRAFQPYVTLRANALKPPKKGEGGGLLEWLRSSSPDVLPMSERPLSPERGQLLLALNMVGFDLTPISLRGATFSFADLENQNLSFTKLQGSDLYRASFKNSVIFSSDFTGANLVRTNFDCTSFDTVKFNFGGGTSIVDYPTFRFAELGIFTVGASPDERDHIHWSVFEYFDLTDAFLDGMVISNEASKSLPASFDQKRYRLEREGKAFRVKARDVNAEKEYRRIAERFCDNSARLPIDIRVGRNFLN